MSQSQYWFATLPLMATIALMTFGTPSPGARRGKWVMWTYAALTIVLITGFVAGALEAFNGWIANASHLAGSFFFSFCFLSIWMRGLNERSETK